MLGFISQPIVLLALCSFTAVGSIVATTVMRARRLHSRTLKPLLAATGMGAGTLDSPRVAASDAQAEVLRAAWAADTELAQHEHLAITSVPSTYYDGDTPLFGRLVWSKGKNVTARERPGILLVHTAVGPSDLFLLWRAEALASYGYVVLIVDCFGDDCGRGWDPSWATHVRQALADDRSMLARRMRLAMETLSASPLVDVRRIAALGYCFGGRAVLDLLRTDPEGLRAVVSFHGLVDALPVAPGVASLRARVLLCHADADPYVPPEALSACLSQLSRLRAHWQLLSFGGGTLHGFTNPAQALNEKPQFAYDAHAARASWVAAKHFLEEALAI